MPSLASPPSVNANISAAETVNSSTASPLSRCGTSEEHLSMEHLTRSEVFAKKPLQRVTSNGDEVAVAAECNNGGHVELPFTLLPGEYARWYSTLSSGILITLTNFRLFVLLHSGRRGFYNFPIQSIDTVECRDMFYLHVTCKDGRVAKITFENNESCISWWRLLNSAIMAAAKLDDIFAFAFYAWCKEEKVEQELCLRSIDVYLPSDLKGTNIDDDRIFTELEFSRLEFDPSIWRITELNNDYRFCSTYPRFWIVPASITDSEIESAGRYRSMRRVPAIVWRHRSNGAVLVRCSQPESGIFGWRSPADEALLHAIVTSCARQKGNIAGEHSENSTASASPMTPPTVCNGGANTTGAASPVDLSAGMPLNPKHMLILDARSYTAAWANRAKGGGFESTEYYQKCEIQFLGLANIHSIRYSFQKLRSLCWDQSETNWFQNLETCQWIHHLWSLLASAVRVAEALHVDGRPVLVHCSDGWDRTTQIVSLAKLFLDAHCRTMKGFKELIDREWIAFGHKFAERSGTTVGDINQRAPVFLQWLDCVHYVLKENPCAFEFNETYLVKLAQHVYSGLFGTFLCNSIAEYVNANVASRTFSIWSYLHPANRQFRNVLYVNALSQPILPRFQQRDLAEVWRTVYCPPGDPANCRPRSFSTASMDGDSAAAAAMVNKQSTTAAPSTSALDRSLTRAHSCDNLVPSIPPSASSDNLALPAEKLCSLHRTGSDSSLTKMVGINNTTSTANYLQNSGTFAIVEKDTEEVLRSLVDVVEKSIEEKSDILGRSTSNTPGILRMGADSSVLFNISVMPKMAVEPISDQSDGYAISLMDLGQLRSSNSASTTTVLDQAIRGTDISTSTTDLNHCCGSNLSRGCQRANGFLRDLNENCTITLTDGAIHLLDNAGRTSNSADNIGIVKFTTAPSSVHRTVRRKGRSSPRDLIDADGMTTVSEPTQERVREIIANYERQLENAIAEVERYRLFVRMQYQNGHSYFPGDRMKHLSVEDGGDSFEPHSFGSRGSASDASWEAVNERDAHPVLWVPDHASNRCMRCDSVFTVINRRHHCRSCGKLFCNACTSHESSVPDEQLFDLVRVCTWCFANLHQQEPQYPDRQQAPVGQNSQTSAPQQIQLQQTNGSQHGVLPQEKVSA